MQNPCNKKYKNPIILKDGEYLDQIPGFQFPSGIIEKNHTGIGATNAEIKAARNSILVFPSRSIPFNKAKRNTEALYVGSSPMGKSTTKGEIKAYHNDSAIKYKKILVVSDSLPNVFDAIGDDEVYRDYFFFYDEIDKFQGESDFRTVLESCLDYFLDRRCRGCLVSATLGDFGNKRLASLPRLKIEKESYKKVNLNLLKQKSDKDVIHYLVDKIFANRNDKFLIAHKSVEYICKIVAELDIQTRNQVKILCGSSSIKKVDQYYGQLENDKLPGRINFMTAAYFYGVDIYEPYHLIAISDYTTNFSLLTLSEMRQIVGRCRGDLLSAALLVPDKKYDIPLIKKMVLADKARELLKAAKSMDIKILSMGLDQETVNVAAQSQLGLTYEGVQLIRKKLNGQYSISHFTIDKYLNRNKELRELYRRDVAPIKSLSAFFNVTVLKRLSPQVDIAMQIRQQFYAALANDYEMAGVETSNEIERKVLARYEISRNLHNPDRFWIIQDLYWDKVSFRKEFIARFVRGINREHGLWNNTEDLFEIGKTYTREHVKLKIASLIPLLSKRIDIKDTDYLSILSGIYEFKSTTSKGENVIRIDGKYKQPSPGKFPISPSRISFEGT